MNRDYFERVPTKQVLSIGKSKLNSAFKKIKEDWKEHLILSGVKLPRKNTAKYYQLAVLKCFEGKAVHKDDIASLLKKLNGETATDQQIRHLKTQGGWFILNRGDFHIVDRKEVFNPEGCHVLITTQKPYGATIRRREIVKTGIWEEILSQYDHTCASCGTKIGESHRFDPSLKVESLEKGHMDPNKPLEKGNIIPQCRWCNKTARGDFTFDEQGRPRAVASVRPVRRADDKVVENIREWILSNEEEKRGRK